MSGSGAFGFELGKLRMDIIPFLAKQRQALSLTQGIPKDYFIYALSFRLQYREAITAGTTNGTVLASAPEGLIEQVEISGNHKVFGDYVRLRLQGSHIYQRGNIWGGFQHERSANLNAGAGVQDLNRDNAPTLTGAVANLDFSVNYMLHLVPPRTRPEEALIYLLDPPLWNSLNVFVDWGDQTSYVQGGDRTLALAAYGSGSGSPALTVWRHIAKLKADRFKLNPVPIKDTYISIKAETTFTDSLVSPFNVGNFLRSLIVITGVRASAGSIAKVGDAWLSLNGGAGQVPISNGAQIIAAPFYTRVKIRKDDIAIRDMDWVPWQEWLGDSLDLSHFQLPNGWSIWDFAEGEVADNTIATSFDTRQIALQNLKLTLEGDVTGAVDQRIHLLHNELAGIPVYGSAASA